MSDQKVSSQAEILENEQVQLKYEILEAECKRYKLEIQEFYKEVIYEYKRFYVYKFVFEKRFYTLMFVLPNYLTSHTIYCIFSTTIGKQKNMICNQRYSKCKNN